MVQRLSAEKAPPVREDCIFQFGKLPFTRAPSEFSRHCCPRRLVADISVHGTTIIPSGLILGDSKRWEEGGQGVKGTLAIAGDGPSKEMEGCSFRC